jgi:hypothetical protein
MLVRRLTRNAGPATRAPGRKGVLAIIAIAALSPLLALPVPMDTDAQGFGMLALAIRDGGTLDTLAPWRPAIAYLYSPGALLLFATTSHLTGASMPAVMMGASHAAIVLIVWLAWELGAELAEYAMATGTSGPRGLERKRWSWATGVSAALSVGAWTALLDSHYTAIFGLLFLLAFVTAQLRYLRAGGRRDWIAAVVLAAAVPMTHADTGIILGMAAISLAAASCIGQPRMEWRRWLAASLGVPLGALAAVAPWLAVEWPLIRAGVQSPFEVDVSHWRQLVLFHGVASPLLAAAGAVIWLRLRQSWAIAMVIWLGLVVETSLLGLLERMVPAASERIYRFNFPFSLAWHGPIVPYLVLGAGALVWVLRRAAARSLSSPGVRAIAVVGVTAVLAAVFGDVLLPLSRRFVAFHGAFSSAADLGAMRWIRDHAPPGARILNYPGDYEHLRDWESHWAPVVTERDCVYFRMQPFFITLPSPSSHGGRRDLAAARAEQEAFLAFWRDPADPTHAQRLAEAGIDYVLVPEAIGDPASLERAWRWQEPARMADVRSTPDRASYLTLAFAAGGAAVYRVERQGAAAAGEGSR